MTTISFDGIQPGVQGSYTESGYQIVVPSGSTAQGVFGVTSQFNDIYSGSPAVTALGTFGDSKDLLRFSSNYGSKFNLTSVDIDTLTTPNSSSNNVETFIGTKSDGSTVTQSFTLDKTRGFQTFSVTGFRNIVSFTFDKGGAQGAQLDNIIVSTGNSPPVAVNDTATAREAGGINNGTAGINPTGNVLTNDTDADAGDTKTVQGFEAGSHAGTVETANTGTSVNGQYGALVLNADGTYTYTVDNTNTTVDALNTNSTPLSDVFTYTEKDGAGATSTATLTVSINGADDAPVATTSAGTTAASEQVPVAVDAGLTVSDVDNTTLSSATVKITGNYQAGEDVLGFTSTPDDGNITGSYNAGSGTLTLTSAGASATKAQFQAALQSVTYDDTSDTPNTANRTISFSLNDGTLTGAIATKTVSVTAVDDAPVNTVPGPQAVDATARKAITGLSIADVDAGAGIVTTTLSDQRGALTVATVANGAAVTGNGTMSVVLNGTVAQINTTLSSQNGVVYQGVNGTTDTLTVTTNDNGNTGTGGPLTVANTVAITVAAPSSGGGSPGQSYTPTPGPDYLVGTGGNDTIAALAGDDTVFGQGGNDLIAGNQGNDLITVGDGSNTVFGGMDQDTIRAGNGSNILLGNEGNDVITAGSGLNTVFGGMGNDLITVGDGGDLLFGGEGSDTIQVGNGNNTIVGGTGNSSSDSLDGADYIVSGSGNDLILGNGGDDTIASGAGNDTAVGGYGNDLILGQQGNDIILGNQGDDTLVGGMGNDTLVGGQGNDVLYGNEGDDVLYGNEGSNRFVFNPGDTDFRSQVSTGDAVMDFKTGTDKIDFASGPVGTATDFASAQTASTDFASIQALAQTLLNGTVSYAFVANGTDGFLFTTGGSGMTIQDAVKLAGAGTATSFRYQDIAHAITT